MKPTVLQEPPGWCKNAAPSPEGWRDPKTNELLISVRGIELVQETIQDAVVEDPESEKAEEEQESKVKKTKTTRVKK